MHLNPHSFTEVSRGMPNKVLKIDTGTSHSQLHLSLQCSERAMCGFSADGTSALREQNASIENEFLHTAVHIFVRVGVRIKWGMVQYENLHSFIDVYDV